MNLSSSPLRVSLPIPLFVGLGALLSPLSSQASAPAGRYATPGSGVVHDTKTGLDWQQISSDVPFAYAEALSYCSANTPKLPGTGWRLPSPKELLTLVDDRATSAPSVDTAVFPSTQAYYWSSAIYAPDTSLAWFVEFSFGGTAYADATKMNYVRCVR